jgi:hypothetical protein
MRVEVTLVSVIFTGIHVKITLVCVCGNHTLRVKSHFAWRNRTLRVKIILVHVKITLVRVVVTFVLANSLCRSHTRACRYHTREWHIHTCVRKSHFACKISLRVKSHSAGGNCSLRVEIILVRV